MKSCNAMDPISFLTHFCAGIGSIVVTIIFALKAFLGATSIEIGIGALVFGCSATCLYFTSSLYHYYQGEATNTIKLFLRKLDHGMIYIFIAGSYTPFIIAYLNDDKRLVFGLFIWGIALLGVLLKVFWLDMPRVVYTSFYLLMGWLIVFDLPSFMLMDKGCFMLMALGGISYTVGALIYILKKPNLGNMFGFHEIFHVFIMIGTFFQFLAVYFFVL
ncbi:PAQR family membrane homeostasis protein TrhA [Tannockella kyphosi]|uniref:PAQR family membrane homeostasis protein TrhA n=1 Tax=Tannockella kyphosi TaxID=2899121 RepID=UPI0020137F73|nr:hemolysin III family protein [Tannockella kyphosi]